MTQLGTMNRRDTMSKETAMTMTVTEFDTTPDTAALAIRPFRIDVPEADLVDLRRRIAATRWPDRETVTDHSQGVPVAKLQELVPYGGPTTTGGRRRRG